MRHRNTGKALGRNSSHRKAMFKNMAVSLFEHEIITTTLVKAKELRRIVERLITLAKVDNVAKRRLAFSRLRDRDSVTKLFNNVAPRFQTRLGGYTRVLKCGFRAGDSAPMAIIELVDRAENQEAIAAAEAKAAVKKTKAAAKPVKTAKAEKTEVVATQE